jgi:hypothetical protein
VIFHVIAPSFLILPLFYQGLLGGSMTDFVGMQKAWVGLQKGQKSPFDSQCVVVELDQESRFSLFRFLSCPGHEVTG